MRALPLCQARRPPRSTYKEQLWPPKNYNSIDQSVHRITQVASRCQQRYRRWPND
jgi:hypothetical protein